MQNREAGEILGGKYRLVRQLGQGGMGSVWHSEHLTLSSPVALKLIDPATAKDPDTVQRFLREARTAAALRSPHVVQILDYGVDGDTPYIAMEMLEGESLADRLTRVSRLGTRETARVIQHVARAMARAHDAGIVHRDLKPENVFIVKNDDEEVIKVLDFGIVKTNPANFGASASPAATRTGTLLGTPYFMSPEQAAGEKSVDHRTDIWALGVIAFKCMIGHLPFNGDSVGKLILEICSHPMPVPSRIGTVPAGFDAWFARACARDPAARFQSAKQAAAEFTRLDNDLAVESTPPSLPAEVGGTQTLGATTGHSTNSEIASRPKRRPGSQRALLVAFGAAVLAGLSLWSLTTRRGPSAAPPGDAPKLGAAPTPEVTLEVAPAVAPTPNAVAPALHEGREPAPSKSVTQPVEQTAVLPEPKPARAAKAKSTNPKTAPANTKTPTQPAVDLGI